MSTIRLSLNDKLEEAFKHLEEQYVTLSRIDLVKLGLSKLVSEKRLESMPVEYIDDPQVLADTKAAGEEYVKGETVTLKNPKEIREYFKELDKN